MKQYIVALMLACSIQGHSQDVKQATFVPPFDFTLTLSGNFGEIRANHFHGGLDFKTQVSLANRYVRSPTDIFPVFASPMGRDMYSMWCITTVIRQSTDT